MKRFFGRVTSALWRLTFPLRRPLHRKLERYLMRCFAASQREASEETAAFMNHVVRELLRLQRQVEELRHAIDARSTPSGDHSIAGLIPPEQVQPPESSEQLKAG
jgi:hypothetical protein